MRPLQGRFGGATVYSDDPVEVALGFCSAGARWLHVVDLDGALGGVPANRDLVLETARLATCPVQAGGGMRTLDDVEATLSAGASRVVLGAASLRDPDALAAACKVYRERIAVSLDARGRGPESREWTVGGDIPVLEAVAAFGAVGVSLFVYTSVLREGSMSGPDIEGLRGVVAATSVPVVASGGIATLPDLCKVARLSSLGVRGAIVGRALYEHKFGVGEANRAAEDAAAEPYDPEDDLESPG